MLYSGNMTQQATYWATSERDEFGNWSLGDGVLVMCRWQDVSELFRDEQGREFRSNAIVYCSTALARRGYLALGDQRTEAPKHVGFEIRLISLSPSLDGSCSLQKVVL
jgi:hypothetical protein